MPGTQKKREEKKQPRRGGVAAAAEVKVVPAFDDVKAAAKQLLANLEAEPRKAGSRTRAVSNKSIKEGATRMVDASCKKLAISEKERKGLIADLVDSASRIAGCGMYKPKKYDSDDEE